MTSGARGEGRNHGSPGWARIDKGAGATVVSERSVAKTDGRDKSDRRDEAGRGRGFGHARLHLIAVSCSKLHQKKEKSESRGLTPEKIAGWRGREERLKSIPRHRDFAAQEKGDQRSKC